MNAFAGIRPKGGGSKPDPLAFFPGVCSGVICFPVGVQPHNPPANFYPGTDCSHCTPSHKHKVDVAWNCVRKIFKNARWSLRKSAKPLFFYRNIVYASLSHGSLITRN